MELNLNIEKIEERVVGEVADQLISEDRLRERITSMLEARVNELYAKHATEVLTTTIDKVIADGLDREFQSVDEFGRVNGPKTTVSNELKRLVGDFWSEWVDRNGNPTASSYNKSTRAEYIMMKICAKEATDIMQQASVNVTAQFKDELRNHIANGMNSLVNSLFQVASMQDQKKKENPLNPTKTDPQPPQRTKKASE